MKSVSTGASGSMQMVTPQSATRGITFRKSAGGPVERLLTRDARQEGTLFGRAEHHQLAAEVARCLGESANVVGRLPNEHRRSGDVRYSPSVPASSQWRPMISTPAWPPARAARSPFARKSVMRGASVNGATSTPSYPAFFKNRHTSSNAQFSIQLVAHRESHLGILCQLLAEILVAPTVFQKCEQIGELLPRELIGEPLRHERHGPGLHLDDVAAGMRVSSRSVATTTSSGRSLLRRTPV